MNENVTVQIEKTSYVSIKITFVNTSYPEIKIKKSIGENGVCNIENVSQYFNRIPFDKDDELRPKTNRIQIAVNRYDLSIRLIDSRIWSYAKHLSYYKEEDGKLKKIYIEQPGWHDYSGSTTKLDQEGVVYVYPDKIKLTYKIKEKSGRFIDEICEKDVKKNISQQNQEDFYKNPTVSSENKNNIDDDTSVIEKECLTEKMDQISI